MITITERAKDYLHQALERQGRHYLMFGVRGGGCAGFSYYWEPADSMGPNDFATEIAPGYFLAIDAASQLHVIGSQIDYVSDLISSQLVVENPMAKSSCGCGVSFHV